MTNQHSRKKAAKNYKSQQQADSGVNWLSILTEGLSEQSDRHKKITTTD